MSSLPPTFYGPICGLLVVPCIFLALFMKSRSRLPLPPGPKTLPLVGNLFNMPASEEWKTYRKWSAEFDSDIIHLNVAGKSIIVLSSIEATSNLMVQRSSIYSDRPRFPMVVELMGWDFAMGFMKYVVLQLEGSNHFRRGRRKLFSAALNSRASTQFRPMELGAAHALLRRILENPEGDVIELVQQMVGGLIMSIAYGIDVLPANDPYLKLTHQSMHGLSVAATPGKYLVDAIPVLKYIPSWFPGAGFKRQANKWREVTRQSVRVPFEETKRRISTGKAETSFLSQLLSMEWDSSDPNYSEDAIRDAAGSIFNAGNHTTVASLGTFALAMLLHPDTQKMAQLEIDSVVGRDRLPTFEDKPTLPYITAVVNEVLRWSPVAPLGIPHFIAVEDEYRGYRIPAGSIVIGNTWAILNDEALYPAPSVFNPERFLPKNQRDGINPDPAFAFGYGRRACPGQFMALDSLWITVASLLAAFDITKAMGEDGKEIEPSGEYLSGLACIPLPFQSSIKPRSKRSADLVEATAM
ncbi:cytochrome P450 [Mycena leptocephala]|nr:cytochrome P450 [Mycena leptocephala]